MEAVICVFAKPPVAGEVKTRLGLAPEAAALLARAFLDDTLLAASALPWATVALATTADISIWPAAAPAGVPLLLQGDGDLGARIERVMRAALGQGPAAIAIGADAPALPARLFEAARVALRDHDAVLGPADDGGFYLLGLRRCPPSLLEGLPWSAADTCARTLERLHERGFHTAVLEPWFDVDRPEDLSRLRALLDAGALVAPRTRAVIASLENPGQPGGPAMSIPPPHAEPRVKTAAPQAAALRISVILPVLDEEARICERLADLEGFHEVIVVDGGSRDRTRERVAPPARLIDAPRGRGAQMNAGAARATGEVLLFLHADVSLPLHAPALIGRALADPRTVAGAFRTWHFADDGRAAPWLHLADLRSRYTSLPYGDQALFVRPDAFARAGGFPEQPLMEDLELSRRLRKLGRIARVPASVRVSGRRFLAHPLRDTLLVNLFPLLYRLGVPASTLARYYENVRER